MTATADLAARCTAAIRARAVRVALLDLAEALDVPAGVLRSDRGQARLVARRAEAVGALERLSRKIDDPSPSMLAHAQAGTLCNVSRPDPVRVREWADAWERFASEVDP